MTCVTHRQQDLRYAPRERGSGRLSGPHRSACFRRRSAASALPTGLSLGKGTPRIRQTDRPFGIGTPCLRQTERTVGTAPHRVSIFVILPVVFPATGEANLEVTSPLGRRMPAARTRVRSATRFSHYRSQIQRLDVLPKPSGAANELLCGRSLLLTGTLVHTLCLSLSIHVKYRAQHRKPPPQGGGATARIAWLRTARAPEPERSLRAITRLRHRRRRRRSRRHCHRHSCDRGRQPTNRRCRG